MEPTPESLGLDLEMLPPWQQVPIIMDESTPDGIRLSDGRLARVPALPYQWWVDSDGNVVPLVVSTNRDVEDSPNIQYAQQQIEKHRRRGWKNLYRLNDDSATALDKQGKPMLADGILKVIAERRAAAKERGKRYEKPPKETVQLVGEALVKMNADTLERVLDKFTDEDRPRRPRAPKEA